MKKIFVALLITAASNPSFAAYGDMRTAKDQFLAKVPAVVCGSSTSTDDLENSIANKIKAVTNNKDYKIVGSPAMTGENVCVVLSKADAN